MEPELFARKKISRAPLYIILLILVGMIVIITWTAVERMQPVQYKAFDFRTFDRPIIADAPGCEIRSPKGDLINQIFKGAKPNGLTLEKGTSFTIDCFPIQQSEKSTTVDPQNNKAE